MVPRGPPSDPGGPSLGLQPFLGNFILFSDIMSLMSAVTSCVTSWCHMCTGHVTFCYKRSADTLFKALLTLVHSSSLPLSPACGWCLTYVGHDTSGASPSWSLFPLNVIIVLALVNSTMSPEGTLVSQRDPVVSPHSLSVPLPQDCCAFWLVPVCIVVGVTPK